MWSLRETAPATGWEVDPDPEQLASLTSLAGFAPLLADRYLRLEWVPGVFLSLLRAYSLGGKLETLLMAEAYLCGRERVVDWAQALGILKSFGDISQAARGAALIPLRAVTPHTPRIFSEVLTVQAATANADQRAMLQFRRNVDWLIRRSPEAWFEIGGPLFESLALVTPLCLMALAEGGAILKGGPYPAAATLAREVGRPAPRSPGEVAELLATSAMAYRDALVGQPDWLSLSLLGRAITVLFSSLRPIARMLPEDAIRRAWAAFREPIEVEGPSYEALRLQHESERRLVQEVLTRAGMTVN